jgi:hypothetical protein
MERYDMSKNLVSHPSDDVIAIVISVEIGDFMAKGVNSWNKFDSGIHPIAESELSPNNWLFTNITA